MGTRGIKKITVDLAKEMWDMHEKGKTNIAIAAACDCSELSVKRMIDIYEYARDNPGKPIEIYPRGWSEIKKAAREKFTPPAQLKQNGQHPNIFICGIEAVKHDK